MKQVVIKKREFGYRDMSRLKALFDVSAFPRFQCKAQNQWSLIRAVLYKRKTIDWDLMREFKALIWEKDHFEKRHMLKLIAHLDQLGLSELSCTKIDTASMEWSLKNEKLSNINLVEEIRHGFMENYEFDYW